MNCPVQKSENAELVLDYFSRQLAPEIQADLERHIENCADCQEVFAAQRAVWNALDLLEEDTAALRVSEEFDWNLKQKIAQEDKSGWMTRTWNRWFASEPLAWRPVHSMGMAMSALVLGAAIFVPWNASDRGVSTANNSGSNDEQFITAEVERIETALEDLEMLSVLNSVKPEPTDQKKM